MTQLQAEGNVTEMFNCMNLCHSCIAMKKKEVREEDEFDFDYKSPSEDEACLLNTARQIRNFGYFLTRDSQTIGIQRPDGQTEQFKVLKYNEFDSKRKCSSIVVRNSDGKIFAYVMGSDSSMMRMARQDSAFKAQLQEDVDNFARKGLRTLVLGYKEMDLEQNQINEGLECWDDLPIASVESDLTLVGATGVEDLLQENVKKCIEDFR